LRLACSVKLINSCPSFMRNGRRTGIVPVYILSIPENAAGKQPAKVGPFIRNLPTFPSNNSCSGECDKTGPFRDGAPPSTPSFPTASDYEADPVSCSAGELPDDPVPAGWLPLPFSFGQPQIPAPTSCPQGAPLSWMTSLRDEGKMIKKYFFILFYTLQRGKESFFQ